MLFDFDEDVNKFGLQSTKWEFMARDGEFIYTDQADPKYGKDRVLPMWVADMDFRSPPEVVEALVERARQGVYGYTTPGDSYYGAVMDWVLRRHGRRLQKEWLVLTPGVVPAINMMVQTFTQPGDKVLLQRPVYYPFFQAIENNGREIVSNSLLLADGRYHMDFVDLADKAADPAVKMAILCSPHNPIGRVWTAEELKRFGDICLENDVLVIADEIHCDLIFKGTNFTSFANISETFAQRSIVCVAASKTFNVAGLKTSSIIIPDAEMRESFKGTIARHGLKFANPFGLVATEAAYKYGEPWLTAVMEYVEANFRFMAAYLAEHLPQLKIIPMQGTYLLWVDCRALGLTAEARKTFFLEQVHLLLDEGELFGPEGEGFERFNLACPRSLLVEALERLKTAVQKLP